MMSTQYTLFQILMFKIKRHRQTFYVLSQKSQTLKGLSPISNYLPAI